MLVAQTIIGGAGSNRRRELDFYATPKDCTIALLEFLNLEKSIFWEPACGDGAISEVLKDFGHTVTSTDISNRGYGEAGIDYLTCPNRGCEIIITNPPFCFSEQFIRKALTEADMVIMLLKSQYWHARKRYELFEAHPPAYILPLTWRPDFCYNGKGSPTMEFAWNVWLKHSGTCDYIPLKRP